MLRLAGTLAAVVALAASATIVVLPSGSAVMLPILAVLLAALVAAALLRAHPATFAAACLLGWFGLLFAGPFTVTDRELNALRRAAGRGDEAAGMLIGYFETFAPYNPYLLVAITALIIGLFLYRMGRGEARYERLLRASDGLARMLTRTGLASALVLLPLLILAIMYDVIQRKYLGFDPAFTRTEWYRMFSAARVQELEWHLHATLFLLCLGYAYVRDAHVRIELVREGLAPRTRAMIELAGCLLFMVPYCYVVMKYGIENAVRSYTIGERSAAQTGLDHRFVIKTMLPLGFSLIALAGMSVAMRCIVFLWGPASLKAASGTYAYSHLHPAAPAEPTPS
ncbi:TRAP transporter small permease subunit [Aureimonas populi]|uniref:TRAP transporter small permease protein n=1 Tax=Aureimonas populi TaxID=1701758 RepID=A0ABW5CPS0_9HYPH|nr:TRAP transporter small permease subunit [Aureimonas populi]